MSDLDRLVAVERLRDLKARQDHALDRQNWAVYDALHADDHPSRDDREAQRAAVRTTVHHSHSPRFEFESSMRARGVWGTEKNVFWAEEDAACWSQEFGFVHETYEKRDGQWLVTARSWHGCKTIETRRATAAGR